MWRLSGSMSARSGDASKKYDGFRTTNWSSGALLATMTAAVPANALRRAGHGVVPREVVLEIRREDFSRQSALREDNELEVALQELGRNPPCLGKIRPPAAELMVDDGRIHEHEELLAARGARLLHNLD